MVKRIGEFDTDNRAGLERTLHRISAIRNRRGHIVGLTCRVGRAVYGTTEIIKDLIESGKSLLLLGRPGVGKTTMLREAARLLAETKRVVIVDTSNEIGGDGDVPHPAVGRARRMQVSRPSFLDKPAAKPAPKLPEAEVFMKHYDRDKSGDVTLSEFNEGRPAEQLKLSPKWFNNHDKNKDGVITLDEARKHYAGK